MLCSILNKAFDGQGNYSLGIKEHTVFPELIGKDPTSISIQINIETSASNNKEAQELLSAFGFPFQSSSVTRSGSLPGRQIDQSSGENKGD